MSAPRLIRQAEELERLARRPLQPRRELLRELAARMRTLAALHERERSQRRAA